MNWPMVHAIGHIAGMASTPMFWLAAVAYVALRADHSPRRQGLWVAILIAIMLWATFLWVGAMCGSELYQGLRAIPAHASGRNIA